MVWYAWAMIAANLFSMSLVIYAAGQGKVKTGQVFISLLWGALYILGVVSLAT